MLDSHFVVAVRLRNRNVIVLVRDRAIYVTLFRGYVLLLPLDGLITFFAGLGDLCISVRFCFRNVALRRGRRFRLIACGGRHAED